jgi:hypothetical protein
MKTASVIGVGVIILGFFITTLPVMADTSLNHIVVVPDPVGFERAVVEAAAMHAQALRPIHYVEEPVITPKGSGRVAAEVRSQRSVGTKCEPSDTSRAVLDKENQSFERPSPNTNVFGKW